MTDSKQDDERGGLGVLLLLGGAAAAAVFTAGYVFATARQASGFGRPCEECADKLARQQAAVAEEQRAYAEAEAEYQGAAAGAVNGSGPVNAGAAGVPGGDS